jgi:hypothetical protein
MKIAPGIMGRSRNQQNAHADGEIRDNKEYIESGGPGRAKLAPWRSKIWIDKSDNEACSGNVISLCR